MPFHVFHIFHAMLSTLPSFLKKKKKKKTEGLKKVYLATLQPPSNPKNLSKFRYQIFKIKVKTPTVNACFLVYLSINPSFQVLVGNFLPLPET